MGIALLFASVLPVAMAVLASDDRPLTDLEQILFTLLTLLISIVGSALVSAYFSRTQARETYVQLARPAWRRVVELNRSAGLIGEAVQTKLLALKGREVVRADVAHEWLDSLARLTEQHAGQLQAAISDWQELLPEEYEELREVQTIRAELDARIGELSLLQKRQSADARKQASVMMDEIARLREQLDERTAGSLTLGGGAYSIRPSHLRVGSEASLKGLQWRSLGDLLQEPPTPPTPVEDSGESEGPTEEQRNGD